MSVREIPDIIEGERGTFETVNVDVAELQVNAMARSHRSREVLRDFIIGAFARERSGYRWGEGDDSIVVPGGFRGSCPEVREVHDVVPATKKFTSLQPKLYFSHHYKLQYTRILQVIFGVLSGIERG